MNSAAATSILPPHHGGHEIHVHRTTMLDGRKIAQNTAKHFVSHGNMATGRMTDLALTRPYLANAANPIASRCSPRSAALVFRDFWTYVPATKYEASLLAEPDACANHCGARGL
jgi:hypothetical protein